MLPLVGAIAQGRAGPCSAWVVAPLLHWSGFSAARVREVKVSENVSGVVWWGFFHQLVHLLVKKCHF